MRNIWMIKKGQVCEEEKKLFFPWGATDIPWSIMLETFVCLREREKVQVYIYFECFKIYKDGTCNLCMLNCRI